MSSTSKDIVDKKIKTTLKENGYLNSTKLCDTLLGSIWSSVKPITQQSVIIKITNKKLHQKRNVIINGEKYFVEENIFKERDTLKYLTTKTNAPKGIVKYIGWFTDEEHYFLVEQHGGNSMFDFTIKGHEYIQVLKKIEISEWHKLVQLLFKQMVNTIDYMHKQNVSHFDISLENMLINDVNVCIDQNNKLQFIMDDANNPIEVKICDLGLAEIFENDKNGKCTFASSKHAGKHNYKSPEVIAKTKSFAANKNDIWCLGVCLFMMIIGGGPFETAQLNDKNFRLIIQGKIMKMIKGWGRTQYITEELVDLLSSIFKYEDERISMEELKQHPWLK